MCVLFGFVSLSGADITAVLLTELEHLPWVAPEGHSQVPLRFTLVGYCTR